jgi:hypothetical protein
MPEQQETQAPQTPPWSGRLRVVRSYRRSLVPRPKKNRTLSADAAFASAANVFLPWDMLDYPGKYRGLLEVLGGKVKHGTLKSWMGGRREPPQWARDALADALEAHAKRLRAALMRLRASPAGKGHGPGFTAVDPVTGLDGRVKSGHRRGKVKEL